mmetsp:Transcript_56595/g.130043  ORF Transcript_56595/g.130043 Transcript_56595/m.130043 type:complete len:104 (+) Transcript_56595:125-436(+)
MVSELALMMTAELPLRCFCWMCKRHSQVVGAGAELRGSIREYVGLLNIVVGCAVDVAGFYLCSAGLRGRAVRAAAARNVVEGERFLRLWLDFSGWKGTAMQTV